MFIYLKMWWNFTYIIQGFNLSSDFLLNMWRSSSLAIDKTLWSVIFSVFMKLKTKGCTMMNTQMTVLLHILTSLSQNKITKFYKHSRPSFVNNLLLWILLSLIISCLNNYKTSRQLGLLYSNLVKGLILD